MEPHEAQVNVTFNGGNGELPDPVSFDASDADVRGWVSEALRGNGVPGITVAADMNVDLHDFVVDRFGPTETRPHNLIQLRPKTPFGA